MSNKQNEAEGSFNSIFSPLTTKKAIILLALSGFCLFFYSLFNNFVGDDNVQIVTNSAVHSLQNIPKFFLENRLTIDNTNKLGGLYYKPLFDTYYTIMFFLFKTTPFFFHFFQLALIIANTCILFLILKKFFAKSIAFLLSLFFLVHPINSEVALYIADAQDALFFFFGILSLWILMKYQSQKSLLIVNVGLLFSLFSKETGILFILISLVYVGLFKRKFLFLFFGYSSVVVSVYALLRIHAIGLFTQSIISAPIEKLNLSSRLVNIPSIFLFYIKTFFFPLSLSGSWQWVYTHVGVSNFFIPLLMDLLFLMVMVVIGVLIYSKSSKKYLTLYIFFSVWFLLGMIFHLQLFPLDQTAAERWFYFPIVGLLGIGGILLEIFKVNLKNKWIATAIILLIFLLSARTFIRSLNWVDDFTIALHDSKVSDSYNAEYIISHSYYMNGQLKLAKIHAERSIQLFPYITNYTNLGAIDSRMGDYKTAKEAYMSALKYGEDTLPYENLAALSLVYSDPNKNIDFIKNVALKKYPKDGILWFYLTILEYNHGSKEEAKKELTQAKRYYPNNPNTNFIEYIITNNKILGLKINGGSASFYTK